MRYTILLNTDAKKQDIETQEQARFVKSILEALEVPIEWNSEEPLSVESKMKLRHDLGVYKINVINDSDGGMKVFVNNERIGEWYKCSYKMKRDANKVDVNKQLYLEMQVNCWTIFEKSE